MKRAVRRALLLSALAAPSALYALGLGEIRLNSALNQPFDADIELVAATAEDLGALQAALASGDTFQRYGLDRPAYLSDFTFRVSRSGGRDVLKVTSPRPVTEPFVTLLVEASWPRGRLLREYTVLLDPPVFASTPAATAPVAAPRAASEVPVVAPRPEPRPAPAPAPVEQAVVPQATVEPGSTYRVRPNDTLWRIASAANPGPRAEVNRMMVAIFEANPAAFGGNINVLRADSELRIPASSDVAAISAAAAADEVARQYRQWSQGTTPGGQAAEAGGRLRLVTPDQGTAAAAPTPAPAPAAPAASPGSDTELQDRLQRLEAELSETRRLLEVRSAELATLQGGAQSAEPVAAGEEAVPASPVPDTVPPEADAEPEAAAEPETVPAPKPERKKAPPPAEEPSLFDRLQDYWWALLGLLVAGLGVAAWLRRRRQSEPAEDSLEQALGRRTTEDLRSREPVGARSRESDILVEERQPAEPAVASRAAAASAAAVGAASAFEPARRPATVEDTLSGEGAASIEAGDPLAEADFHIAYGLYDQAAELVQVAARRDPQRRDLKLKLIEIFFVWGNRERFLEIARDLYATRARAEPGEWDKILIMGRQLAPEEALFAGAGTAAPGDLDLELFGGAAATDFELPGGEGPPPDLDLTVRSPEVRGGESLDFLLDEPVRGASDDDSALAPTVETPRVRSVVDEPTAEVSIEDLGLDTTALEGLEDITQLEEALTDTGAAVEDTVQEQILERAADLSGAEDGDLLSSTSMLRVDLDELAAKVAGEDRTAIVDLSEATGELPGIDLDDVEATGEIERIDLKVGGDITMSEVGTKLDLARAYVDMGDPEGARSILEEVLKEGSPAHKQEAERLLAVLP